jgi:predicted Zn-dependent peptidase
MIGEIIHQEVREKRSWTYSMIARNYHLGDVQELTIDCPALSLNALDEIESVVSSCFEKIGSNAELFEQLKAKTLNRLRMIDISGVSLCKQATEYLITMNRIPSYGEWERKIRALTIEDVTDLMPWVVPEMRWTLISKP